MSRSGPSPEPPLDLAALVREHAAGLAGAIRGVLAARGDVAEVLQEAVAKALTALARGTSPRDPVGWLFVVAMNTARDWRRRRLRENGNVPLEQVPEMNLVSNRENPSEACAREEALVAARAAVSALRDGEKDVFLLRTSAGLGYEAIAEALGIPVGTAKTRMRAALQHLRARLLPHAPPGFDVASLPRDRQAVRQGDA